VLEKHGFADPNRSVLTIRVISITQQFGKALEKNGFLLDKRHLPELYR
jgi:hypothetical protein